MKNRYNSTFLKSISIIFIFVFFIFFYSSVIKKIPYHVDEYIWLSKSYYINLYISGELLSHNLNSPYPYDETKLTYYIYGTFLNIIHKINNQDTNNFRSFLHEHYLISDENINAPVWTIVRDNFNTINKFTNILNNCINPFCRAIEIINKVRSLNILLASINVLIIFYLSLLLFRNLITSVVNALFWGTNIVIVQWSIIANAEVLFLLFYNLALYILFYIYKNTKHHPQLIYLLAFVIALATSVKLHGLFLLVFYYFITSIKLIRHQFLNELTSKLMKSAFKNFTILTVLVIFFISIIDPLLWNNPFKGLYHYYIHRRFTMLDQQKQFPNEALINIPERMISITNHFISSNDKNNYSRSLIAPIPFLLNCSIITIGIWRLLIDFNRFVKARIILFYSGFIFLNMFLFLYLDWARYYNILILPYTLILMYGATFITTFLTKNLYKF